MSKYFEEKSGTHKMWVVKPGTATYQELECCLSNEHYGETRDKSYEPPHSIPMELSPEFRIENDREHSIPAEFCFETEAECLRALLLQEAQVAKCPYGAEYTKWEEIASAENCRRFHARLKVLQSQGGQE